MLRGHLSPPSHARFCAQALRTGSRCGIKFGVEATRLVLCWLLLPALALAGCATRSPPDESVPPPSIAAAAPGARVTEDALSQRHAAAIVIDSSGSSKASCDSLQRELERLSKDTRLDDVLDVMVLATGTEVAPQRVCEFREVVPTLEVPRSSTYQRAAARREQALVQRQKLVRENQRGVVEACLEKLKAARTSPVFATVVAGTEALQSHCSRQRCAHQSLIVHTDLVDRVMKHQRQLPSIPEGIAVTACGFRQTTSNTSRQQLEAYRNLWQKAIPRIKLEPFCPGEERKRG